MRQLYVRLKYGVIVLFAIVAAITGCSEEVVPVLGTDLAYSIYGIFTPDLDTQWVRVFPIEGTLELRGPERLDATVTSTDLATGEVRVWSDSLLLQRNGGYEHAFWSPFRAEYGHTYKLEVKRSDGVSTSGMTSVPGRFTTEMLPFEQRPTVVLPHVFRGDAEHVMKVKVDYHIIYDYNPGPPSSQLTDHYAFSYDDRIQERDGEWVLPINLTEDYDRLRQALTDAMRWEPEFGMVILGVSVELLVASEEWAPPGGIFDPEVLGMPNVMSNVENGFGLVVSGYRLNFGFFPPDEASKAAGFRLLSEVGQ